MVLFVMVVMMIFVMMMMVMAMLLMLLTVLLMLFMALHRAFMMIFCGGLRHDRSYQQSAANKGGGDEAFHKMGSLGVRMLRQPICRPTPTAAAPVCKVTVLNISLFSSKALAKTSGVRLV
jgi:biopolymer transport protein ExbB/TolQ